MISFSPLFPVPWLWGAAACVLLLVLYGSLRRVRGILWRGLAGLCLVLAAAGPVLYTRQTVVPSARPLLLLAVDNSGSQQAGDRPAQTAQAVAEVQRRYAGRPDVDLRTVYPGGPSRSNLFQDIELSLKDGSQSRLAGIILVTDGQIHDRPGPQWPDVPLHVLLTGHPHERDSRITLIHQPGYGVVGQQVPLTAVVEDEGSSQPRRLTVRMDGKILYQESVLPGQPVTLSLPVSHTGPHWVDLDSPPPAGDLNPDNNQQVFALEGVRDRLRVLLVSGRPHLGERMWRHVLKQDPALDLVHFTILRQPEQLDPTPQHEMALIPFPVQELFEEKLPRFDLVILDRPQQRSLLDPQYFRRLAEYVQDGGALLVAVGGDFSGPDSIAGTDLAGILPVSPLGVPLDTPFVPRRTAMGDRHPITAALPRPQQWGHWQDMAPGTAVRGHVLLQGAEDYPLLLVDEVEKGRVALLLSSDLWRWGRGMDGGGPQGELVRRLVHWLLRESSLESTRLTAWRDGQGVAVEYRGMEDQAPQAVTLDGRDQPQPLTLHAGPQPGQFLARLPADHPMLPDIRRVRVGALTVPVQMRVGQQEEDRLLLSTDRIVALPVRQSGGQMHRLSRSASGSVRVPEDFSLSPRPAPPGVPRPFPVPGTALWLALAAFFSVWSWLREKN